VSRRLVSVESARAGYSPFIYAPRKSPVIALAVRYNDNWTGVLVARGYADKCASLMRIIRDDRLSRTMRGHQALARVFVAYSSNYFAIKFISA